MGEKRKPHVYIDPRYVTEDTPDLFEERDDLIAKLRADLTKARKALAEARAERDALADDEQASAEALAAVREWATEERPAIPKCLDPGHDDRWCSHCDSMMDGVGHAQATVLRILDGDVNL